MADLLAEEHIGLDTETYGLRMEDKMFCLQLATAKAEYYFNFHDYIGCVPTWERAELLPKLEEIFGDRTKTWFIHNAKFDLHKLLNEGVLLLGTVHCTQAIARLIYNQHMSYSLSACLRRIKLAKDDAVAKYIKEHKLWTKYHVDGKKKVMKDKHFDKVPFPLMFEYGCIDVETVRQLGMYQLKKMYNDELYYKECRLVKTCFSMERAGVMIDKEYTEYAKEKEKGSLLQAIKEAEWESGEEYKNGPKWLRAAFDKFGQPYDINSKTGNPIFDKGALEKMQSPIAKKVQEIRRREKYIGTYYSSFLHFSDDGGVVHANIRQAGTDTGRFSYSDPNLQNVPKEEDFSKGEVQVRKCFTPRADSYFVMIDYDQQEYRLMLDYAGEMGLIRKIMDHGECVHQATADLCDITRKAAKQLNFGLLYGMGVDALAEALGIPKAEAKDVRKLYFSRLPKVRRFINNVKDTATARGYIKTWAGRRLYFPDPEYAYKAPNHLIQGGCGDIAREAMNRLNGLLAGYNKSNMVIQVHDEIVFEINKNELDIIDSLRETMENVYVPINGMKLTCGVEHSSVSWGKQDVIEGKP